MKFPLTRDDVECYAVAARFSPEALREQVAQQNAFIALLGLGVSRDRAEHIIRRLGGRGAEDLAGLFARHGAEAVREAVAGEIR